MSEESLARVDTAVKPHWFLDWSGQACAIIAPGASVKTANLGALRGKVKVIAIKEVAVDLCPWADVAYGCDAPWWRHRQGLPDFRGLKIGWDPQIPFDFVMRIRIRRGGNAYTDEILIDEPGVIGGGKNSGFQALNLAIQFGVNRVLLVGFDLSGGHYYGRNNWFKAGNPDAKVFQDCIRVWNENAPFIRSIGVQVVNANSTSALRCFPRHSIEDTLQMWGL